MTSRQDLIDHRDVVKATLINLEKQIAKHPDTIKEAFHYNPMWDMDKFEELILKLTLIRWQMPSDKGAGEIKSVCHFILEDKLYTFQEIRQIGGPILYMVFADKNEIEFMVNSDILHTLWDNDDPITYLREKGLLDFEIIGTLLALKCTGV